MTKEIIMRIVLSAVLLCTLLAVGNISLAGQQGSQAENQVNLGAIRPLVDPCRITKEGPVEGPNPDIVIRGCVTNVEFGRAPDSCIIWFGNTENDQFIVEGPLSGACNLGIASVMNKLRVIAYQRANSNTIHFMKFDRQ